MGLALLAPPAVEPVGLNEVKDWCRIDTADGDATLASMITAARQHLGDLDGYSALSFITQTYTWTLDAVPAGLSLDFPRWPVQSVTSVTYRDAAGISQTWPAASYQVDVTSKPARLAPVSGGAWPTAQLGSVTIRFVAGYGASPDDVPEPLRLAIKALVAHWNEYREPVIDGSISQIPMHVTALVAPHRLHQGVG